MKLNKVNVIALFPISAFGHICKLACVWTCFVAVAQAAPQVKEVNLLATEADTRTVAVPKSPAKNAVTETPKASISQVATKPVATKNFSYDSLPQQNGHQESRQRGAEGSGNLKMVLATALKLAVARSPSLKQADAELGAAKADIREAEGQRWPQVDVSANSRAKSFGGSKKYDETGQSVNVNMTTNVFDWGRTEKTIDSRKELGEAATQKYLVNLEVLAQDVSKTVLEKEKARRASVISQQYVERMKELVGMLERIVMTDRGRASELVQAQARLMEAEASRDNWLAKERDAEIKLRKLIGDAALNLPQNIQWTLPQAELDRLLALAKDHPALRQAEAEAKASRLQAESLRAGEKPQLNWVVTKSVGGNDYGREDPWQTMVTVSWPIFRGGSSTAAREAAMLRAEAGFQNKENQQLELEFETRAAVQDAATLLARANLYTGLIKETGQVKTAFFDQWYHLGRRTLLDVLIAESDYNNNRINEVSYRFDSYLAVLKAYGSSGMLSRWLLGDVQ
ncbi:TPA: TolC family protein [Enterobacter cloacae]